MWKCKRKEKRKRQMILITLKGRKFLIIQKVVTKIFKGTTS